MKLNFRIIRRVDSKPRSIGNRQFFAGFIVTVFAGCLFSAPAQAVTDANVNATLQASGGTTNWGDTNTWAGLVVPNGIDDSVNISGAFSANLTLNLTGTDVTGPYTLGNLAFKDTAGTYRDLMLGNGTIAISTTSKTATWLQNTASGSIQALISLQSGLVLTSAADQTLVLRVTNAPSVTATDVTGPAFRFNANSTWTNFAGTLVLGKGLHQMNAANVLSTVANPVTLGEGTDAAYFRMSSTTGQLLQGLNGNAQSFVFNNITAATASTLTISNTADASFAGTIGANGNGSFTNAGINIAKSGVGTQTLSGSILNQGSTGSSVTVSAGTLVLSGSNNYTGATTVNGGTLKIGNAAALGSTTSGTTLSGGNLDLNGQTTAEAITNSGTSTLLNSSAGAGTISTDMAYSGGAMTVNNTGDINAQRIISTAARNITKSGAGMLTTSGTNHNSLVGWVINQGTVNLANTAGLGADRGVTINNGGTLKLSGANNNLINDSQAFTVNTGGTFDLNGKSEAVSALEGSGGTVRNSSASAATLWVGGGGSGTNSGTWSGVIENGAGTLNLTKEGTGTQTLTGVNTYTGTTTVTKGSLLLSGAGALSSGTALAVSNAATFDVGGRSQTFSGLTGAGSVTNASGTLTVNKASGSDSFAGVISGAGALTKSGNGTLLLSGSNTYTGGTMVTNGTLQVASGGSIAGGVTTVASGSFLDVQSGGRLGVLTNRGTATISGVTGAVNNSGTATISGTAGAISSLGTTTIASGGTGGALTVEGGITTVNGTAGNTTVSSGGTLKGSGTVGALEIASGGTLAVGNSPGLLHAGNTRFIGGSVWDWEVTNFGGSAGSGFDFLDVSGDLTLDLSGGGVLTIALLSLVSDPTSGFIGGDALGFDPTSSFSLAIASASGSITGFNSGSYAFDFGGFTNSFDGDWSLATQAGSSGTNLMLTYTADTAIPEPGTGTLVVLGLGVLLVGRRFGMAKA